MPCLLQVNYKAEDDRSEDDKSGGGKSDNGEDSNFSASSSEEDDEYMELEAEKAISLTPKSPQESMILGFNAVDRALFIKVLVPVLLMLLILHHK